MEAIEKPIDWRSWNVSSSVLLALQGRPDLWEYMFGLGRKRARALLKSFDATAIDDTACITILCGRGETGSAGWTASRCRHDVSEYTRELDESQLDRRLGGGVHGPKSHMLAKRRTSAISSEAHHHHVSPSQSQHASTNLWRWTTHTGYTTGARGHDVLRATAPIPPWWIWPQTTSPVIAGSAGDWNLNTFSEHLELHHHDGGGRALGSKIEDSD